MADHPHKSKKRKADKLAGKGSFLDALRIRRKKIEKGKPKKANKAFRKALKIKEE